MEKYLDFISLIKEFIQLFDALISVEQQKLDAAVSNQVSFVEECMKKEQAFVLRLRGLEKRRESLQENMDMKDFTFSRILEKAPPEAKEQLSPLFQQLSQRVRDFQNVNESAKDAIQLNLYKLQSAIQTSSQKNNFYSASGEKVSEETHFTNRFA
ncbi:MAG TPA: flagellar protein FlgN [Candidatus Blautia stercoravium]|nr:flagellar protein FlgN [Candidatus Blautia stercoravium]